MRALVDRREDETWKWRVWVAKAAVMARRVLSEILQPRAEEIFSSLGTKFDARGYEKSLNSGIVLTGGAQFSKGCGNRRAIFDLPSGARITGRRGGLADSRGNPSSQRLFGLALYAQAESYGRSRAMVGVGTSGAWRDAARTVQEFF